MKNNIATNLTIDTWFPIAIGTARCPFIKEIKNDYKEAIKNYSYDENGFCNKQVYEDPQFNKLNNWPLNKYYTTISHNDNQMILPELFIHVFANKNYNKISAGIAIRLSLKFQ